MNSQEREVMNILSEECAEVIQAISKCRRFGIDESHLKAGVTNRVHLTEEFGDLLCMIDLAIQHVIVEYSELQLAKNAKEEKLKKWSNIFKEQS